MITPITQNLEKMNREILFRAKTTAGEWIEGLPFYSHGTWKMTYSNGWVPSFSNPDEGESTLYIDIDPKTVGQFTGLLDSKGNKIFEGDILQSEILPDVSELTIVHFQSGCFMIQWAHDKEANLDLLGIINYKSGRPRKNEIIGNVLDNPELLTDNPTRETI